MKWGSALKKFFTSESVTDGHPDKLCDQIADAVLDEILLRDPYAHVACEVVTTKGLVHIIIRWIFIELLKKIKQKLKKFLNIFMLKKMMLLLKILKRLMIKKHVPSGLLKNLKELELLKNQQRNFNS